jgi:hypothetical protein
MLEWLEKSVDRLPEILAVLHMHTLDFACGLAVLFALWVCFVAVISVRGMFRNEQ